MPMLMTLMFLSAMNASDAVVASQPAVIQCRKSDGYCGMWYANEPVEGPYRFKYSGGLATYPAVHTPIAAYSPAAEKTFFVYGGTTDPENKSPRSLLIMASYYDHKTGQVPKPSILLDKKTDDAHDNPAMSLDAAGHIWVFAPSHGTARPAYIFRSARPHDIDAFEQIVETNFSYPQPWYVPEQGFLFLHTRYLDGRRVLHWMTSKDGAQWSEPQTLASIERGHYQISGRWQNKVATAFSFHPEQGGLNARTNLYYVESTDFGKTWQNAARQKFNPPLTAVENIALVRDYAKDGRLVYVKDLTFDHRGNPILLYVTAKGHAPGPESGPRFWTIARWTGREWEMNAQIPADHNYDMGSLYPERRDLWRLIAPTGPGPQPFGAGGDVSMWTTEDQGRSWLNQPLTRGGERNHSYVRRPVDAHEDFYALWADGNTLAPSSSSLYFTTRQGLVFRLPSEMREDFAEPQIVTMGPSDHFRPSTLHTLGTEVFLKSPRPGVRLNAHAFYTRPDILEMMSVHWEQTQSDKFDAAWRRFSTDNGKTWSESEAIETHRKADGGTFRRTLYPGFVDEATGKLITMIVQGVLPSDKPLEGMKHWTLRCAVSEDGGRTIAREDAVVQRGKDFNEQHPLPGVWVGKNSIMLGDKGSMPIRLKSGDILVPVQITPVGPDGEYHNPGGGYTYHDSAVLIGRWSDNKLEWTQSALIKGDPARSTRGTIEPTIAEMSNGRILMVLRGSNDKNPQLPGYRWYSISLDRGRTWSTPRPWMYTDGTPFYSPSSCSQLLSHSNGRTYWIGNITSTNPQGNNPRYPLAIGEVDSESLLLIKSTVYQIETRSESEPAWFAASNFFAYEDRQTNEIRVHCSPMGKGIARESKLNWTADARVYRVSTE